MIASYHNHSRWSDGAAPVDAIVARARELGLGEVGISDHFILHPSGVTPEWAMEPGRLRAYADDVLSHAGAEGAPLVRLGLEVDWFPGQGGLIAAALAAVPFDYLIGSVHEVDGFVVDLTPADWDRLDPDRREQVHRGYWESLASLAESRLFDVVGHLDLPKKFGQRPAADLGDLVATALDAIRAADLVVELNTSGWHAPCCDAYPSLELLVACREREIPVTLSADAHHPDHLRRDFGRGLERLAEAGFRELARFAGRRRWLESVAQVAEELVRVGAPGAGGL